MLERPIRIRKIPVSIPGFSISYKILISGSFVNLIFKELAYMNLQCLSKIIYSEQLDNRYRGELTQMVERPIRIRKVPESIPGFSTS